MAVTSHIYPTALLNWAKGATTPAPSINPTGDTFTAGLCTASAATWTSTQWVFATVTAVTGAYTEVATGGGYTQGYANRQALTTFTYAITATANIIMWTCTAPSPISFGASTTISAASMFINDKTANSSAADGTSWPVVIIDFGGTVSSTSGAFTYTVAASPSGLAFWTAS